MSRTAGYALNAVIEIARRGGGRDPVPASGVAEELDIPFSYLAKILKSLAHEGILRSERGRTGGFSLARQPAEIRLIEVVAPFDALGRERECLLGRGTCSELGGCPVHREWCEVSAPAFRFFEERTVADLLQAERVTRGAPGTVDGSTGDIESR